jgi:hypothetical protein
MPSSTSHSKAPTVPPAQARWGGSGDGGDGFDDSGGGGGGGGDGGSVRVAIARNEAEGELIRTLLIEQAGIPSYLQSISGLLPSVHVFAPRNLGVMVAAGAAEEARKVLADTWGETEEEQLEGLPPSNGPVSPGRLAFWIFAVGLGGFLLLWLVYQLS